MGEYKLQPAELLNVPLACIYHAVAANSKMELQQDLNTGQVKGVWLQQRGWIIMVIKLDLHVTPLCWRAAGNVIFLSAGSSLLPGAEASNSHHVWLRKTHALHSH